MCLCADVVANLADNTDVMVVDRTIKLVHMPTHTYVPIAVLAHLHPRTHAHKSDTSTHTHTHVYVTVSLLSIATITSVVLSWNIHYGWVGYSTTVVYHELLVNHRDS